MSRYGLRDTRENKEKRYKSFFKERGVGTIKHFTATKFYSLKSEEMAKISVEPFIWRLGSRFYKLADEAYGDPSLWWVIAYYNKKPTDF